jgi:hypothetical protein
MIPSRLALTASSESILNANPDNDKNHTALYDLPDVIRVTEMGDREASHRLRRSSDIVHSCRAFPVARLKKFLRMKQNPPTVSEQGSVEPELADFAGWANAANSYVLWNLNVGGKTIMIRVAIPLRNVGWWNCSENGGWIARVFGRIMWSVRRAHFCGGC